MSLGPVVASAGLPEHEVVGSEDLAEGAGPDGVHGAGLQVHQDGPGHVLPTAGLVVVDIDPLQLEVGSAGVGTGGVDAVLVRDDFPELEQLNTISPAHHIITPPAPAGLKTSLEVGWMHVVTDLEIQIDPEPACRTTAERHILESSDR